MLLRNPSLHLFCPGGWEGPGHLSVCVDVGHVYMLLVYVWIDSCV